MAAVFLAPFYLLCNAYILYWMIRWLHAAVPVLGKGVGLILVLAVYSFLMMSLLTSFLVRRHPTRRYLKKISDQWLGSFAYILGITLILDVVHRILSLTWLADTWLYSREGMVFCGSLGAAGMAAVVIYGIHHAGKISLTRYQVKISKKYAVEGKRTMRIALLADLHLRHTTPPVQKEKGIQPTLLA